MRTDKKNCIHNNVIAHNNIDVLCIKFHITYSMTLVEIELPQKGVEHKIYNYNNHVNRYILFVI